MSPSNPGAPNSSLSPSGGANPTSNLRNDSGPGGNRSFSSPDAHRPSSANPNDPPISPPNLPHPQFFFPQQPQMQPQNASTTIKPASSPGSPGSVKSAKSNNNGSILERALASHVKQEGVQQVEGGAPGVPGQQQQAPPQAGHGMMPSWPPQHPQQPHHQGYDLGSEVFMKSEIADCLDYHMDSYR